MSSVRYLVKYKLNSNEKDMTKDVKSGSLAREKIFYEGLHAALRKATIDGNNIVYFTEICYCLEALYPLAMEIPVLKEYFESVSEVRDARFRDQCTMECEFCDCTGSTKLPGRLMTSLYFYK